jgi:hypothetical protein
MPPVAHADAPAPTDSSTVISDYGMPASTSNDSALVSLASDNSATAVDLAVDPLSSLGGAAIPAASYATPSVANAPVIASGGDVNPDTVPEPAAESIVLIAGLGLLTIRRRRQMA